MSREKERLYQFDEMYFSARVNAMNNNAATQLMLDVLNEISLSDDDYSSTRAYETLKALADGDESYRNKISTYDI